MPTQPAVFELLFKEADPVELDETPLSFVIEGQPYTVRCVTDEEHFTDIRIKKGDQEHTATEIVDSAFEYSKDNSLFECEATSRTTGEIHSRKIRLMGMVKLNVPQCSAEQASECGQYRTCGVVGDKPTCFCPPGVVGKNCEENSLMIGVKGSSVLLPLREHVVAGGGFGIIVFAIIVTLLGILLFRERKRTKRFVGLYGQLPEVDAYGEPYVPVNPYKKISAEHFLEPKRTGSLRNAFRMAKGKPVELVEQRPLPLVDQSKLTDIPSIS